MSRREEISKDPERICRYHVACQGPVYVKNANIVGYCHLQQHPGYVTRTVLQTHRCVQKKCSFLEKYTECPYWRSREGYLERKKSEQLMQKIVLEKEEQEREEVKEKARQVANLYEEVLITSVLLKSDAKEYLIFYVSPNKTDDSKKYEAIVENLKDMYGEKYSFSLKHIKKDGEYINTKEYMSLTNGR